MGTEKKISLSVFVITLIAAILFTFMGTWLAFGIINGGDAGILHDFIVSGTGTLEKDDYKKLEFVDKFFNQLSIYTLDDDALMDAILKGYSYGTGDKYSAYYTEEEWQEEVKSNSGENQGIGISIMENDEHDAIEVVMVYPNSPAEKAGVEPGDMIVYVGNGDSRESVAELGYDDAQMKLKGVAGTKAEFTVKRGENYSQEVEFSILRETYEIQSVVYHVCQTDSSIGIIKIIGFDLIAPTQFRAAMDDLISKGIKKFVFDVRSNPGGDLKSIAAILSGFLNEGDRIMSTVYKDGTEIVEKVKVAQYDKEYAGCSVSKSDIGKYRGYDYIVLTNESTASAAELFTIVMKDYGLAETVGTKTYGKGIIQTIFDLSDFGYSGFIKLTVGKYNPPVSENYHGVGIFPTYEVKLSEEAKKINIYKIKDHEDNQLMHAIEKLNLSAAVISTS